MGLVLLVAIMTVASGKLAWIVLGSPWIRYPTMLILSFFFVISIATITYLTRLWLFRGRAFEVNEKGLVDRASPLRLGVVPLLVVNEIGFAQGLGQEFLFVKFKRGAFPEHLVKGWIAQLYRSLMGGEIWIPLALFNLSRHDAETQIIYLDALRKKSDPQGPKQSESTPVLNEPGPTPPPLESVPPEKRKVILEVNRIRQEIKNRGLDRLISGLYFDQLAFFPNLVAAGEALPQGVSRVAERKDGADYDEVKFFFKGHELKWGLRRDVGASDEALLSVGFDKKVVMLLRVKVEIGELAPLEIEGFLEGPWVEQIFELQQAVNDWVTQRLGPGLEVTASGEYALDSDKIDDLKNRFGLRD